jgi:phenylpropionate dioxygenase-like ring-hydroxylating dioxygenase large terminal subunit
MSRFLPDSAVIARVLAHIEAGTTDVSDAVWREPVENYRSPARLQAEIDRVLRRRPTVFCPATALPAPGHYLARRVAGRSILVVRDNQGVARAFLNVCRHRGAEVAGGTGCAKAFVCPYHGWTYDLDGSLRHVPHEHGFPGLERDRHGLVPVAACERHGLIFIVQDPGATEDAAGASADDDALPDLLAPEQRLLSTAEGMVPANWKIHIESFLEGYHIRIAHRETFYPYGFDNLNLVERSGPHSRVTFPFRRIRKLAAAAPDERQVDGRLTYVYHLFPNAIVAVLSRHTTVVIVDPIDAERTHVVTYTLTNPAKDGEDPVAAAERDIAFVKTTGAEEDLALVSAIQRGMGSGANQVFTFGRFEGAIAHFHRCLDAALAL